MLTKLTLNNFKCFSKPTAFALKRINIFTGYNGRGKSTAIQSLLLLAQSLYDNKHMRELLVNGIFCKLGLFEDLLNSCGSSKTIDIDLETDNADEVKTVSLSYCEKSDRKGKIAALCLDGKDYFEKRQEIGKPESVSDDSSLSNFPPQIYSLFQNFAYVSADRLGPTAFEVKQDLYDNNPIGNNGEFRLNVLAGNEALKAELSEIIVRIMEGGRIGVKGDQESEKSQEVLKLYFNTLDESRPIKSINSGFGYSYIIPILLAALNMKDGCLFIENPEAHLHPYAQSQLMKELVGIANRNNIQLFIESHSEHVINAIRLCTLLEDYDPLTNEDVSIYFFDKDMTISHLKMHSNAQMDNWPKGFFDQAESDSALILKLGLFR